MGCHAYPTEAEAYEIMAQNALEDTPDRETASGSEKETEDESTITPGDPDDDLDLYDMRCEVNRVLEEDELWDQHDQEPDSLEEEWSHMDPSMCPYCGETLWYESDFIGHLCFQDDDTDDDDDCGDIYLDFEGEVCADCDHLLSEHSSGSGVCMVAHCRCTHFEPIDDIYE